MRSTTLGGQRVQSRHHGRPVIHSKPAPLFAQRASAQTLAQKTLSLR